MDNPSIITQVTNPKEEEILSCMGKQQGSTSGEFCVIAHRFWKLLGCRVYALLRAVLVKRGERTEIGNRVCGDGPW
uniref:Uncharacterized protein n=1 Tax=Accipiter nisus TaxID=211598 RepID=A0A8B9N1N5_9AVES